jgi:hypothetical protein
LDSAITSARNARRWKWYALIIVSKWLFNPAFLQLDCPREFPTNPASFSSHHHCYRCRCRSRCYRGQQEHQISVCFALSPMFSLPTMYDLTTPSSPRTKNVATRIPNSPRSFHLFSHTSPSYFPSHPVPLRFYTTFSHVIFCFSLSIV